jgi:predicted nuclease of predicted toxin-antitoxin system
MLILLDECVPKRLKKHLPGHSVQTVREMGWSGVKNGALLKLIGANNLDVFITVDQKMVNQQNLQGLTFAIVVLIAPSNRVADLVPLMPRVDAALTTIQAGDYIEIRT